MQSAVLQAPGSGGQPGTAYFLIWQVHLHGHPSFANRYHALERITALLDVVPAAWVEAARAAQHALAAAPAQIQPPRLADALQHLLPRLGWLVEGAPLPLSDFTVRSGTHMLTAGLRQMRRDLYFAPFVASALDAEPGPVDELLALLRRLWRVRWENERKEAFWRLAYDAHPTAARLHLDQPCDCGAAPADRHHHFWACPVAQAVVDALSGAVAPPQPLTKPNIWLARAPTTVYCGVWDVACLAAVAAMDHGRRVMLSRRFGPPTTRPPAAVASRSAVARFWSLLSDFVTLGCVPAKWAARIPPGHPLIHYDPVSSSFRVHLPDPAL